MEGLLFLFQGCICLLNQISIRHKKHDADEFFHSALLQQAFSGPIYSIDYWQCCPFCVLSLESLERVMALVVPVFTTMLLLF